jgi:hypothetical protein
MKRAFVCAGFLATLLGWCASPARCQMTQPRTVFASSPVYVATPPLTVPPASVLPGSSGYMDVYSAPAPVGDYVAEPYAAPTYFGAGPYGYGAQGRTGGPGTSLDPRGSIRPRLNAQLGLGLFTPEWDDESFKTLVPASFAAAFGFSGKGRGDDFDYVPALTLKFSTTPPAELSDFAGFAGNLGFRALRFELRGKLYEGDGTGSDVPLFNTDSRLMLEDYSLQIVQFEVLPPGRDNNCSNAAAPGVVGICEYDYGPQLTLFGDVVYRRMDQEYNSSVRVQDNTSQLRTKAVFNGLGIATEAKFRLPLPFGDDLVLMGITTDDAGAPLTFQRRHISPTALFLNAWGNFVVGAHDRYSELLLEAPAVGGNKSFSADLDDTDFVAIGGLETGFEWNALRGDKLLSAVAAFTLEASSGIGPIDPQSTLRRSNNYLYYGFFLGVGIEL